MKIKRLGSEPKALGLEPNLSFVSRICNIIKRIFVISNLEEGAFYEAHTS
jgi:hypothetical protein